jgi:hypothetical protein
MPSRLPSVPEMNTLNFRKTLSVPALLKKVRHCFSRVKDSRATYRYSLVDILMSGFAIFSLKYSSLLEFDHKREEKLVKHNLFNLYGIISTPSDSQLRNVLDEVNPYDLRPAAVNIIQEVQKQGLLESYRYLEGFIVAIDGTGLFSSGKVHCKECCVKNHQNGKQTFYHQLLVSAIVNPDTNIVLPLLHEPITHQDGITKNDCEQNAAKRLIPDLKKHFPRLNMIIVEDALSGNAPHIKLLQEQGFRFIIRAKHGSQKSLFNAAQEVMIATLSKEWKPSENLEIYDEFEEEVIIKNKKRIRGYRLFNRLSLNKSNKEIKVNLLEYWEVDENGKEKNFSWVTDITLSRDNVYHVMRAGRSRWKIENETFNTLKNLGYNLEHNYGHGKKHLSTIFATLTILAFLIDQVQELSCHIFKAAKNKFYSKVSFWNKIRGLFLAYYIKDWQAFYFSIIYGNKGYLLTPNYPDTS